MKFQIYLKLIIDKIDKKEKLFFFLFSLLNIYHLYTLNFIPSLDGPQHLYISNVIVNLLKSNDLINQYFAFNSVIVGNWTGHFILSFFNFLFPASIAEKLLLSTYYFGIVYSFRYLIISIKGKSSFLSFIIFPFSTTTMVLLSYYNYSFGTIILFITLGYWVRIKMSKMNIKSFISLMSLFLLLYLSHVFVFMLCGLVLVVHYITFFVLNIVKSENRRSVLLHQLKKLTFLFLASLPSILLWINYTLIVTKLGGTIPKRYSFNELTDYLVIMRSLMAFHRGNEAPANISLFILINLIIIYSIISRFIKFKRSGNNINSKVVFFRISDFWLLISFVFLVLYYLFPDQLTSGNITNRISIIMFFLLITWIGVQEVPRWLSIVVAIMFISITIKQRVVQYEILSSLDNNVVELKELDDYIDENSSFITLGTSGNWVHLHFHCYLGIDKSLVDLQSPQCAGQFPVVWNSDKIPPTHIGLKNINEFKNNYLGLTSTNYNEKIQIVDYILINKPGNFSKEETNKPIINVLQKYYTKLSVTSKKNYALYKFKPRENINRTINRIKNNEDWFNSVKEKAEIKGISVDNMLMLDALYLYDKYN